MGCMIKIWKFDVSIKNLEILLEKSSVEEEIELIRGLQAELQFYNLIMQEESQNFEIFSELYSQEIRCAV